MIPRVNGCLSAAPSQDAESPLVRWAFDDVAVDMAFGQQRELVAAVTSAAASERRSARARSARSGRSRAAAIGGSC